MNPERQVEVLSSAQGSCKMELDQPKDDINEDLLKADDGRRVVGGVIQRHRGLPIVLARLLRDIE